MSWTGSVCRCFWKEWREWPLWCLKIEQRKGQCDHPLHYLLSRSIHDLQLFLEVRERSPVVSQNRIQRDSFNHLFHYFPPRANKGRRRCQSTACLTSACTYGKILLPPMGARSPSTPTQYKRLLPLQECWM